MKMTRLLCSLILIHLCFSHVLVLEANSAEYGATADLRFRGSYDDNVFFEGISDFEYLITPSLALAAVTEQTEVQASASLDISIYQDNDELNTIDQYYQLLTGVSPSERFELDFTGTYVRDKTVYASLAETGIVANRNTRNAVMAEPVATFGLTGRDRLQLSYRLDKTDYSDKDFRDYFAHGVRLGLIHDLKNERTSVLILAGANQTDYDDNVDNPDEEIRQRTLRGLVGFDHRLTETATIGLRAGARYTDTEIRDGGRNDEKDVGFIGEARLNYRLERGTVFMRVNQDYVPSVNGENVRRSLVDVALWYRFTERLGCRLSGYYRYSKTDGFETEGENQAFAVRPELNYQLPWEMNLRLGYSYTWAEDKVANDTDDRNRVFVELRWLIHRPEWRIRQPRPLVDWPWR